MGEGITLKTNSEECKLSVGTIAITFAVWRAMYIFEPKPQGVTGFHFELGFHLDQLAS